MASQGLLSRAGIVIRLFIIMGKRSFSVVYVYDRLDVITLII